MAEVSSLGKWESVKNNEEAQEKELAEGENMCATETR